MGENKHCWQQGGPKCMALVEGEGFSVLYCVLVQMRDVLGFKLGRWYKHNDRQGLLIRIQEKP